MRDINVVDQLAWRPLCDHSTVIHDRYAIAKPLSLFHVVRGENDRLSLRLEFCDQVP